MKRGPTTNKLVTILNPASVAPIKVTFGRGMLLFKQRFGKFSRKVEVHSISLSEIYDRCTGQLTIPFSNEMPNKVLPRNSNEIREKPILQQVQEQTMEGKASTKVLIQCA